MEEYSSDILASGRDKAESLALAAGTARDILYPRDEISQKAITVLRERESEAAGSSSAFCMLSAIRVAIGELPIVIQDETQAHEVAQDHVSVSATLAAYRNNLAEALARDVRGGEAP